MTELKRKINDRLNMALKILKKEEEGDINERDSKHRGKEGNDKIFHSKREATEDVLHLAI